MHENFRKTCTQWNVTYTSSLVEGLRSITSLNEQWALSSLVADRQHYTTHVLLPLSQLRMREYKKQGGENIAVIFDSYLFGARVLYLCTLWEQVEGNYNICTWFTLSSALNRLQFAFVSVWWTSYEPVDFDWCTCTLFLKMGWHN